LCSSLKDISGLFNCRRRCTRWSTSWISN